MTTSEQRLQILEEKVNTLIMSLIVAFAMIGVLFAYFIGAMLGRIL